MQLAPEQYVVRIKEIEAGRGEVRAARLLVMDPRGGTLDLPGEATTEPAFGLPAIWVDAAQREDALFRGLTVVDPASVITTHLSEIVRQMMAELLSYSETQKLLDELPREQQKLIADLIPSQVTVGGVQRVLQALLSERVSIRDLPTILEGIQDACGSGLRAHAAIVSHVRVRLARQISDSHLGPSGYVPLITLSAEWEAAILESLVGPADDRHLAMVPTRLSEFINRLRVTLDQVAATGEAAVIVVSGSIRPQIQAIVERIRPHTPVIAQNEISPRVRIRTLATI